MVCRLHWIFYTKYHQNISAKGCLLVLPPPHYAYTAALVHLGETGSQPQSPRGCCDLKPFTLMIMITLRIMQLLQKRSGSLPFSLFVCWPRTCLYGKKGTGLLHTLKLFVQKKKTRNTWSALVLSPSLPLLYWYSLNLRTFIWQRGNRMFGLDYRDCQSHCLMLCLPVIPCADCTDKSCAG